MCVCLCVCFKRPDSDVDILKGKHRIKKIATPPNKNYIARHPSKHSRIGPMWASWPHGTGSTAERVQMTYSSPCRHLTMPVPYPHRHLSGPRTGSVRACSYQPVQNQYQARIVMFVSERCNFCQYFAPYLPRGSPRAHLHVVGMLKFMSLT